MTSQTKRTLDQAAIVKAGLDIVSEAGLEAVSFRSLAKKLDVTPMALYRHFDNKQILLSEMLDSFINDADVLPGKKMAWDRWMQYVSKKMYSALIAQPSWIPLLGSIPLKQSGLKVMNECLTILAESGFSQQEATEGFLSMIHILLGAALMSCQLNNAYPEEFISSLIDDIQNDYPAVRDSMNDLQDLTIQSLIEPGMTLLISGMKQKL